MKRIAHNGTLFSQLFMIVAAVAFVLHLFFKGMGTTVLHNSLLLNTATILQQHEFWRILTFPFSSPDGESFLLFVIAFGFFAPMLESVLTTRMFAASVTGLFLTQAIVFLLAFSSVGGQLPVLAGLDSLSFYVLALFTFILPNRSVRLWKHLEIRGLHLVLALSAAALLYVVCYATITKNIEYFYGAIASAFGVLYAFVMTLFIHRTVRTLRKREAYYHISTISDEEKYEEEAELVSTTGSGNPQRQPTVPLYTPKPHLSDEEMLNYLLDKIYEQGQDSLTVEERSFLEEYSRRML